MGKLVTLTENQVSLIVKNIIVEQSSIDKIKKIQTALKPKYGNLLGKSGPNKDGVDGVYGRRTKSAIRQFQIDNGIKPTGFVGKVTAPKLGVEPMTSSDTKNVKSGEDNSQTTDSTKTSAIDTAKTANKNASIDKGTQVSPSVSDTVKGQINWNKVSSTDSVSVAKAAQPECAKFVNDFSDRISSVGNAWHAHQNESLGKNVWSSFRNLDKQKIDSIFNLWKRMETAKAGKENGQFNGEVKKLVNTLVPKTPPVPLQLDDVVGIFYPPSSHHEEAFMQSSKQGKGYFIKDDAGNWKLGNTITGGNGFGMNTHIGIVGAIKDGVPIVFHNVHGTVFADPSTKLYNGGRVAWIRRPSGSKGVIDTIKGWFSE